MTSTDYVPGWEEGQKASDVPIAKPDLNAAIEFLNGYPVHLWCLTAFVPDGDEKITQTQTFGPGRMEPFGWLRKYEGNRNLHYSINEPRGPRYKKCKREDIRKVHFLHGDFDPRDDETPAQCKARVLAALAKFQFCPTYTLDSGNGIQALWRLAEPIELPSPQDADSFREAYDRIEGCNRWLAEELGGDTSVYNIDRVFRLPGTTNLPTQSKRDKGRVPCVSRLLEATGAVYSLDQFEWIPAAAGKQNGELRKIEVGDLPTVDLDDLHLSRRIKEVIVNGNDSVTTYPSRSHAVFGVICAMLRAGCDPATILAVLANPDYRIGEHIAAQKSRTPRDYALRQIARAEMFIATEQAKPEEEQEAPKGEAPKNEQAKPLRFKFKSFAELLTQASREALVKALIPKTGIVVVWGPPKCGKSFWVFDLTMHIAMDWEYRGLRVKQADVVYLALEGHHGFGDRAKAFAKEKLTDGQAVERFHPIDASLELVKDHAQLIADIKTQSCAPGAVVIDTLNQSFTGSESSDADMTAYIRAAKAVREAFNCAVIIIHHCGHDDSRMRGHSSLFGAVDVEISVKRDVANNVICTVANARDMASGKVIANRLEVVKIGIDEDGDDVTSCVVEPAEPGIAERAENRTAEKPTRTSKAVRSFQTAFDNAVLDHGFPHRVRGDGPTVRAVETRHVREEFKVQYTPNPDSDAKDPANAIRAAFKSVWDKLPPVYGTENYGGKSLIWHTKNRP